MRVARALLAPPELVELAVPADQVARRVAPVVARARLGLQAQPERRVPVSTLARTRAELGSGRARPRGGSPVKKWGLPDHGARDALGPGEQVALQEIAVQIEQGVALL